MRLFLALRPDPALVECLADLAEQARQRCGGRVVPRASLHLTLAFLGEVPESRLDALTRFTEAFSCRPGTWPLDRYGHFRRGGIVWLGSSQPAPALATLYQELHQGLDELGLAPPPRPFLPHVTLLRHAKHTAPAALAALPRPALTWRYTQMELIHSRAMDGRRRYHTLARSR